MTNTMQNTIQKDLATEFQACVDLYNANKFAECLEYSIKSIKHFQGNVDFIHIAALSQIGLGNLDDAEKNLLTCVGHINNNPELFCNLANLYNTKLELEKATLYYQKTLALDPNNIVALNNLGNIYNDTGQNTLAIECFTRAINNGGASHYLYNNIALVYKKLGLFDQALQAIQQAINLSPEDYRPYHNAALILSGMGNKFQAIKCYELAYKYAPNNPQIISEYRDLCTNVCDWDKYKELEQRSKILEAQGYKAELTPPMSDIQKNIDPKHNLEAAIEYTTSQAKHILQTKVPFSHKGKKSPGKKIRIGYLSSDIKDHPVAHLMRGVFQNHNKDEFEIYLYSSSEDNKLDKSGYRDAIFSKCDQVIDIRNTSNIDVAQRIYDDKIDVVIDLNGHTGAPRIEALALKPAPVQISYIGFIGSMGADFIDYIITDKVVTPPDQQKNYLEKFLYMPNCYQANDDALAISDKEFTRAEFGLPETGFVFCSFNQTYKIEPVLFAAWMNILKRVPNSVLWLYKGSIFIHDNLAIENLHRNAEKFGIDPKRLIFADGIPIADHLKRVSLADLALDTRVYNGGTVTSHTLWAGVPVVTLQGGHFASRMASSILTGIGMEELITQSPEEYEELVVKIATTKDMANELKKKLAKNKATYPLFNTKQFTKDIEQLYKNAFENYLKNNA